MQGAFLCGREEVERLHVRLSFPAVFHQVNVEKCGQLLVSLIMLLFLSSSGYFQLHFQSYILQLPNILESFTPCP